ncbi:MAG: PQQ-binding-like beta-propeller repeat protein [Planctomycetota bacterium]|nr:PQQ-binding-like beta-propeller repeat protein [Planctomycetota bacterium]
MAGRGLISVEAKTGRPLWQYEKIANGTANVPTPIVDGDYVFCSSGYGDGGTALLQLSGRRGVVNWREVYYQDAKQLQNHHGGMIKIGNYVYMGEGHNEGFPMCVDFRTGRKMWGKQRGAGTGSAAIVAADGHLYFRYQNGVMALIEADPQNYKLKGSFQIATRNGQSWPHPVIFDGKLLLRDQNQLHCYSLKSE